MPWANRRAMHVIRDQSEIPDFATEAEERQFWDTHSLSEEAIDQAEPIPEDELPPARPRAPSITIRIDNDTLDRLRLLASKKGREYEALLRDFIIERLYEEEKREGLIAGVSATHTLKQADGITGAEKRASSQSSDPQ